MSVCVCICVWSQPVCSLSQCLLYARAPSQHLFTVTWFRCSWQCVMRSLSSQQQNPVFWVIQFGVYDFMCFGEAEDGQQDDHNWKPRVMNERKGHSSPTGSRWLPQRLWLVTASEHTRPLMIKRTGEQPYACVKLVRMCSLKRETKAPRKQTNQKSVNLACLWELKMLIPQVGLFYADDLSFLNRLHKRKEWTEYYRTQIQNQQWPWTGGKDPTVSKREEVAQLQETQKNWQPGLL